MTQKFPIVPLFQLKKDICVYFDKENIIYDEKQVIY